MSDLKPCPIQRFSPLSNLLWTECERCPNRRADQQAVNDALERAAAAIDASRQSNMQLDDHWAHGNWHGITDAAGIVRGMKNNDLRRGTPSPPNAGSEAL